ncbi:MAG TPA: 1-(5-phosphoribosyl)-5-[(5-phosphoribosylamino)methylideneamino]imidazole-4-carboxamide isomerase [Candidatus Atribacteria bacterium]|nr:1-(5-phosphoribosyl)-5-[(5-phosphoribosylamino)methylideneamino]imidazole-4-carboxamide isomerase [Candidatus Atribacteria bacterium]
MGYENPGKLGEELEEVILPIPAIDVLEGKVVRLEKGDYQKAEVFGTSPLLVAQRWEKEGASLLHVVDLEGAKSGYPVNFSVIKELIKGVSIPVEVGGGIREISSLLGYLDAGAERVVLSSVVVKNPSVFEEMLGIARERIVVSIDTRDQLVSLEGWKEEIPVKAVDLARALREKGIEHFIFTDVQRDGTLQGVRVEVIRNFIIGSGVNIIVAGGISCREDIRKIKSLGEGIEGIILGKALYSGQLNFKEVCNILREE